MLKEGFVKVAAKEFPITLANITKNKLEIINSIKQANQNNIDILVLPELCLTGYTIEDLFFQDLIFEEITQAIDEIVMVSKDYPLMFAFGAPLRYQNKLYNVAYLIKQGKILGIVPKIHIPNYHEFYEARHFESGKEIDTEIIVSNQVVPFSSKMYFQDSQFEHLKIGIEICEDVWVPSTPSTLLCENGVTLMLNLSGSNDLTGKSDYRKQLIASTSARLICGYVYANAGAGESTTDIVLSGHHLIYENGTLLNESKQNTNELCEAIIDVKKCLNERIEMTTYPNKNEYKVVNFHIEDHEYALNKYYDKHPFVPHNPSLRQLRCEEVFDIQTRGLIQRLKAAHIEKVVVGISGGLDSTLALLVCVRAFERLNRDLKNIIAITMPGFGTTSRTKNNADELMKELGVTYHSISIDQAVRQHFKDIDHDETIHNITYENSQARERTQILMDYANKVGGIVIGTGDLSEVALGWSTYNGDHMSMYAVNVSVPKTLVRYLVDYVSSLYQDTKLYTILQDILHTPVSPELLPHEKGKIVQKTEEIVGPYELHDFFLYHHARFHYHPLKLLKISIHTFKDEYEPEVIKKWLLLFYRRFFTQQFKRSCIPDGPKVGSVALSPRGDLRMPSDANVQSWLEVLEKASV